MPLETAPPIAAAAISTSPSMNTDEVAALIDMMPKDGGCAPRR